MLINHPAPCASHPNVFQTYGENIKNICFFMNKNQSIHNWKCCLLVKRATTGGRGSKFNGKWFKIWVSLPWSPPLEVLQYMTQLFKLQTSDNIFLKRCLLKAWSLSYDFSSIENTICFFATILLVVRKFWLSLFTKRFRESLSFTLILYHNKNSG